LETGGWGQYVKTFQKNGRVNTSDPQTKYTWYEKHLPDMGTTFWLLNEEKVVMPVASTVMVMTDSTEGCSPAPCIIRIRPWQPRGVTQHFDEDTNSQ
jgi:hypothetical protein